MVRRIVIVGGGIGGLCAARATSLAGYDPVVLERSSAGPAIGAGLVLWPNAVHALDTLQRGAAVRAAAVPARCIRFRDAEGRVVSAVHLDALEHRLGAPVLVVDRPALLAALAEGLLVRFGAAVRSVDGDGGGVTLESGERISGDAVIGADGVGSVVRQHVCPIARPLDTGHTVIRGIADAEICPGEGFEAWGRGELVGAFPLPAGRTYWFYEASSGRIDRGDPLSVLGARRWPEPFPALVAATPPENMLVNRVLRLAKLPTWTRDTVALLGDAAHAMEPNLGQGAAQTIEDAEALLVALRRGGPLPAALNAYTVARQRRAHLLQAQSHRMARAALSTHAGARNLLMRLTPESLRLRMTETLIRRHAPERPAAAH